MDTDLTLTLNYDFNGSTDVKAFAIDGGDTDILARKIRNIKIGVKGMGTKPIAGDFLATETTPKFRIKHTMPKVNHHELGVEYSVNQLNPQLEIIAFGPNIRISKGRDFNIKK